MPVCSFIKGEKDKHYLGWGGLERRKRVCVSFTNGRRLEAALFSFLEDCSYFSLSVLIIMVISRQGLLVNLKLAKKLTMTLNS